MTHYYTSHSFVQRMIHPTTLVYSEQVFRLMPFVIITYINFSKVLFDTNRNSYHLGKLKMPTFLFLILFSLLSASIAQDIRFYTKKLDVFISLIFTCNV